MYKNIKHINYFVPYICIFFVFCVGCHSEQKISSSKCPVCPPAVNCPIPTHIQLSQLDTASRERLKTELLAEIKEEMRKQWLEEFEAQQAKILSVQNAEKKEQAVEVPPVPSVPSEIRPEPLPPTQKIERDDRGMKIMRHTFATQIVRRLPVDERDVFTISDASIFCYAEISSASEEDRVITIRFTHSTGLAQSYTLPVSQSPAWRTWSKLNLTKSMTGTWLCEIFNEDNTLLASRPFVVVDD